MVSSNYRRTVSFPADNQKSTSSNKSRKPPASRHFRSLSLPCGSHPLIFQLRDEINDLKDWVLVLSSSSSDSSSDCHGRNSAWLCNGLIQLKKVQESVDDLLQLPQPRELIKGHNDLVEKLLHDFLVFVDVYGNFQTLILKLKEDHTAAQVAARKRDESKLVTCAKGMKKTGKEMSSLAAMIEGINGKGGCSRGGCLTSSRVINQVGGGDPELTWLIEDVMDVTISVTYLLLNGISVGLECKKASWRCLGMMKKVNEDEGIEEFEEIGRGWSLWDLKTTLKRMDEIEDCLCDIQIVGEKVFRSLLNTRVTLLNVLTL